MHNDPTGHCATLCTAALGALISGVVNYGIQTYNNMTTKNMSFSEAVSWSNIDKKSLTVAVAGGFVAGLTMGAASAITSATIYTESLAGSAIAFGVKNVVGGAVANAAAGQAETVVKQYASPRCLFCWEYNDNGFEDARKDGFGDWRMIQDDLAAGAIWGTLGGLTNGFDAKYAAPPTPWIRGATQLWDISVEYMNQSSKKPNSKNPNNGNYQDTQTKSITKKLARFEME